MKKKANTNAMALLGMMAAIGGMPLPERKVHKTKSQKPKYSDEDLAKLDLLFQDRTSPGRKAYKKFQAELRVKYSK